ncbi:MAG: creatininase family protein [Gemmatimonadetes bacterium]|nr:creatininase family protein [Gemmatimonadota bacterium]
MSIMTPDEKRADGLSLHAGMDEHSLMLYLRPELVARDYRQAPVVSGANYAEAFAVARREGWPGYLGAPHLATAEFGERIWRSFSAATEKTALEIPRRPGPGELSAIRDVPQVAGAVSRVDRLVDGPRFARRQPPVQLARAASALSGRRARSPNQSVHFGGSSRSRQSPRCASRPALMRAAEASLVPRGPYIRA